VVRVVHGVTALNNEIEGNRAGKLNLFNNLAFLEYLATLQECQFTALLVIPEGDAGKAKAVVSTQQGNSPPRCEVVSD